MDSLPDFFSDSDFPDFKASLDAEMKRLQSEGTGSKTRQAGVLTEEEELLWQKELLGAATPQTLLDTMVVCNGHTLLCEAARSTVS